MRERIGLIAGNGRFPLLVLDAARASGLDVVVAAIREETSPEIEAHGAASVHWMSLGELSRLIDTFKREQVARAVSGYFPESEIVDVAFHDWNADPWSNGTWLTVPAAAPDLFDADRFELPGRILLAGSDVAAQETGWFEGALRSGAAAVTRATEKLRDAD